MSVKYIYNQFNLLPLLGFAPRYFIRVLGFFHRNATQTEMDVKFGEATECQYYAMQSTIGNKIYFHSIDSLECQDCVLRAEQIILN